MANVSRYRQGYEDMKREMAENAASDASLPELFVKGIASLPKETLKDFMRGSDEELGRRDAMNGETFDAFRHERAEKLRREQEESEAEAANAAQKSKQRGKASRALAHLPTESSDLIFILIKIGFAIAAFVIALMIVFASLPFWMGGMLVGWLSGFCLGALRAHRLGTAGLREAQVHEGTKSGKYVVSEVFLTTNRQVPGGLALPILACALWCGLLAWPVLQVMDLVPWAGIASAGASITGLILGGLWSAKGFRRSLAWSARCAHGLPGGADAGWGGAGAGLGCILLVFLALMGKSLPATLVHDFAKSRGNQTYQPMQQR